jgi:hypothetical protein
MSKSVTFYLDNNVYKLFEEAAKDEGRSIASFIEFAALSYLANENYTRNEKKTEIVIDKKFIHSITKGLLDTKKIKKAVG